MKSKKTLAILDDSEPLYLKPLKLVNPSIPEYDELATYYHQIVQTGTLSNFGPFARALEQQLAHRHGVKYCISLANLSTGLSYIPQVLGLPENSSIIVPSFTFFATGHSLLIGGCRLRFVDIDPLTLTIDPEAVADAVDETTSAICGVHTYGTPCDVNTLERIAKENDLRLFFDAAHAFGSSHDGVPIGSFGDVEGFSTSATKVFTTLGEGGYLTTDSAAIAETAMLCRNWGNSGDYDSQLVSIVSKMPEIAAAAGLVLMDSIDAHLKSRIDTAEHLKRALDSKFDWISFPSIRPGDQSGYKDFVAIVDVDELGLPVSTIQNILSLENIESRRYFYPPLHRQKAYLDNNKIDRFKDLRWSDEMSRKVITLPLQSTMTASDIEKVIWCFAEIESNLSALRSVMWQSS